MHRFSSAFSSCDWSTSAVHGTSLYAGSTRTPGPTVRRIISSMPSTMVLTQMALGASVWRREKASSRWVSAAARLVAPWATVR